MTTRNAFITGITGQDGSYLAELLLTKGYVVHGLVRRSSSGKLARLEHLCNDPDVFHETLFLHEADLDDATTIRRLLVSVKPDELYHLAGQSHVGASFEIPESTCEFTAMGTLGLLEIIRDLPKQPRVLHMSSSEIFGKPADAPQSELTPLNPVSPYGVAKAFATQMVRVYRESFGMFACNAICYNHESPRRGESFVTRKISLAAARIKLGLQKELTLGRLDVCRDWGFAAEYVDSFWRMLQQETADDYVIATGQSYSLEQFLDAAFGAVDLNWRDYVRTDPRFVRPAESHQLVGNPAKAREKLGWQPKTLAPELASMMVNHDLQWVRQEYAIVG